MASKEKESKEFGMLGRNDNVDNELAQNKFTNNLGITDKFLGSLMNSLMKNLEVQMRDLNNAESKNIPNGIKIRIGNDPQKQKINRLAKRVLSEKQLEKMSSFPRAEAKTNVKRLSDKVIYELKAPGVLSPEDVFVSKLESGYEIKAIGKNKIYVNSFPINLPLKGFSLNDKGLIIEFSL